MGVQQDAVYERVRDAIVWGRIAPGARLTEERIAARTQASRTPVREALQRLASEGFLIARRSGSRTELVVSPLTRTDVLELYYAVGALEGVASRGVADLSGAELAVLTERLAAANEEFRAAGASTPDDYSKIFVLHNAFHDVLVEECAGQRLQSMLAQMRPHVNRYEWIYAPVVGPPYDVTFDEHDAIIAAVATGDPDATEAAVEQNWRLGAARLLAAFERRGAKGDWLL
ncbi:MAG TPA: GntR family transcriptional regulator [Longimicrobiales bacterium]|nr:GntR family transcriptional regulator [Longimicrobiales bacterium]